MAETLLTIQEAAELSNKSVQTIRRALKSKKLEAKRKKTPQGFNYLIKQDSLTQLYSLEASNRTHQGIKNNNSEPVTASTSSVSVEFATKNELLQQQKNFEKMIEENKKDKETFMRFVKVFQERFTALENQVKLLEEPIEQKKWYQFWK